MTEMIISIGLLITYYIHVTKHVLIQNEKIKENEQRIAELSEQIQELKENLYINMPY